MDRPEMQGVVAELSGYLMEARMVPPDPLARSDPLDTTREGWFASRPGPREPWTSMSDVTVIPLGGYVVVSFTWRRDGAGDSEPLLLPIDPRGLQGYPQGVVNSIIEALDLGLSSMAEREVPDPNGHPRLLPLLALGSRSGSP